MAGGEGSGWQAARRHAFTGGRPGLPNWWVILAISLALMALLVVTSGNPSHRGSGHRRPAGAVTSDSGHATPVPTNAQGRAGTHGRGRTRLPSPSERNAATTTTSASSGTTTTVAGHTPDGAPPAAGDGGTGGAGTGSGTGTSGDVGGANTSGDAGSSTPAPSAGGTTSTTPPAPASASAPAAAQGEAAVPDGRQQDTGYLDPPLQTSNEFAFTGSGAMEVSVVWSADVYLTMAVTCSGTTQDVGGTSAMQASLPDASGSCSATVSEPSSESVAVMYTITIGPAGG